MKANSEIIGFLDQVTETSIFGWAINVQSNKPVSVKLIIDEQPIASTKANLFRQDLLAASIHPSGNCGFNFDLTQLPAGLSANSVIRVRAAKTDVELTNSPWYYYTAEYLAEVERETKQIQFADDETRVLILGIGKSGTSILTYRISAALENAEVFFEPHTTQCLNHIEFHREIGRRKKVITKALYYPQFPNHLSLISAFYNKRILIIRDPRDILLSSYFYSWNRVDNPSEDSFVQALQWVQEKESAPDVIGFYDILATKPEIKAHVMDSIRDIGHIIQTVGDDWLVLKYEDFVDGRTTPLNQYLGFSIDEAASVPTGLKRVERTKKYGNWRRWFNQADVARFQPELNDALRQLGYDATDWQLETLDSLPVKEGSEYMKKVFGYPRPEKPKPLLARLFRR